MQKISIVTLNYNGSKETLELLKSLKDQTHSTGSGQVDKDFEIIVVDNASEEADFTNLKNSLIHRTTSQVVYPQVQIVRNGENLGFSGGNNVGIRHALNPSTRSGQETGSDWVVLLNNDTWVEKNFMEHLGAVLSVKTGVVGILLLVGGGRVAYCGKIQWLKPTLIHKTTCEVVYPQVYAIGGAMAIHKDVFEKIGFLDEKYFLYFEDADFSVRARKAGFDIFIAENLSAHHHVSSSTKKLGSPVLLRYHYRNALYFNLKNGPWYIKLLVWPWSWLITIKQLNKIAIKQNVKESKAILAGVIDFYRNKMGKIKTGN
jgi:GT2 family glycosyltransferase